MNALALAAGCAGFALGIRSQIVWLTLPLLALAIVRLPRPDRWAGLVRVPAAFVAGALVWGIPLLIVSGPVKYLRTFWNQGAEDLTGVAMLATTHTVSLAVQTLQDQLISPWGYWQTGTLVVILAILGFVQMSWRDRPALLTLIACFGPYMVFDLLFQEAITTRYALPLVIPIAFLVVRGASLLHRNFAVVTTIAIAAASILADDATAYGYAQMPAPAFRMLGDMHAAPLAEGHQPVLAMHRNQDFSMRRPIQWFGAEMPKLAANLPAPPKHEWLEAREVLEQRWPRSVVVCRRPSAKRPRAHSAVHDRPALYQWPFSFKMMVGGARPNELDWHVFEEPDWYLGEGWALTP